MNGHDQLIIVGFSLICTLLYLAGFALPRCNRHAKAFPLVLIGGAVALLITSTAWFFFFEIFARNYGLGGTYMRLGIFPLLLLFSGIIVTYINYRKGETK